MTQAISTNPSSSLSHSTTDTTRTDFNILTAPLDLARWAIHKFQNLNVEADKNIPQNTLALKDIVRRAIDTIKVFHKTTLKTAAEESGKLEKITRDFLTKTLHFLDIGELGEVLQDKMAEKTSYAVGIVSFIAYQVFHALPYLLAAALVAGTILLFQSSPVLLFAILAGGILMIQVFLAYHLVLGVQKANDLLVQSLTPFQQLKNAILLPIRAVQSVANWALSKL